MGSEWHTEQDIESDIWAFSEMEGAARSDIDVAPPATILEWNARVRANNNPSVFDPPEAQEDVTYLVSGRGRGGISTLIQPGSVPQTTRNVDDDLKRRLREVSGLGYSNELIVQSVRETTNNKTRTVTPEIKLQPIEPSNSSFSRKSPMSSTLSVHCAEFFPRSSPKKSTPSELSVSCSSSSSAVSVSSSSESKPEEVTKETAAPLPLSVMLNRAKKQKEVEQPKNPPKAKLKESKNTQIRQNGRREVDENINTNQNHSEPVANTNEYWWRKRNQGTDSSGDESNCWRRRDVNSPNRYFGVKNGQTSLKNFNLSSSKEFPALK